MLNSDNKEFSETNDNTFSEILSKELMIQVLIQNIIHLFLIQLLIQEVLINQQLIQ